MNEKMTIEEAAAKLDGCPQFFRDLDGRLCADPYDFHLHGNGPCWCSGDELDMTLADFIGVEEDELDEVLDSAPAWRGEGGFCEGYLVSGGEVYKLYTDQIGYLYASQFSGRDYLAYVEEEGQLEEALEAITNL